jgi:hypothetical protein
MLQSPDAGVADAGVADAGVVDAGVADGGDAGPCAAVRPADVSFTPAACRAFAAAEASGSVAFDASGLAPSLTEPSDGDALTADDWSIFAWDKGPMARVDGNLLEPAAHALTPLSGHGYILEFTQGCTEVLRAMVADTFWAPDPASWSRLTKTKGPVTVRVYWAKFSADGIVLGPVASSPISITMKD